MQGTTMKCHPGRCRELLRNVISYPLASTPLNDNLEVETERRSTNASSVKEFVTGSHSLSASVCSPDEATRKTK
jgi:hypothetical protein